MLNCDQLCTFFVDGQMFGVDVQRVQEVIRYQEMTEVPQAPDAVCGLINLRGQIVTAIDLRKRLGVPDRPKDVLPMNVVVRGDDGAISLLVDQIGDVQEIEEANFEPPPETLQGSARDMIQGAYKMEDHLLLILDTDRAMGVGES
ncbi:MAG TPA: chemotaxis protein CheW [Planctomycetaceae bacterium]|nr:chemotaxis protein CheW [Planctomycetaceae bacterium]